MKKKEVRSAWFYLAYAIRAEYIAMLETGLSREQVRAVLARQEPDDIVEAVTGSHVHIIADRLDDEREGIVPTDLSLRRRLREIGREEGGR